MQDMRSKKTTNEVPTSKGGKMGEGVKPAETWWATKMRNPTDGPAPQTNGRRTKQQSSATTFQRAIFGHLK